MAMSEVSSNVRPCELTKCARQPFMCTYHSEAGLTVTQEMVARICRKAGIDLNELHVGDLSMDDWHNIQYIIIKDNKIPHHLLSKTVVTVAYSIYQRYYISAHRSNTGSALQHAIEFVELLGFSFDYKSSSDLMVVDANGAKVPFLETFCSVDKDYNGLIKELF